MKKRDTNRRKPWKPFAKIASGTLRGMFGLDKTPKRRRRYSRRLQEFFRRMSRRKRRHAFNRGRRRQIRALHRIRRARGQNQHTGAKR